ncbi:hypothetical protein GF1_31950 [Desulfolithobacter dissulfuricans]|uniref:Uncharacterized protein n=1 Tax=Desulfolithobacter dissulfuricans TaxID=2795293 RepID=A0A915XJF6_9BACT|nr:hypothetical protein GF1_31950 [Desulfolithobacter dissulfuricans]
MHFIYDYRFPALRRNELDKSLRRGQQHRVGVMNVFSTKYFDQWDPGPGQGGVSPGRGGRLQGVWHGVGEGNDTMPRGGKSYQSTGYALDRSNSEAMSPSMRTGATA